MASVNKVILLGNLGRDPELRHTQAGKAVTTLSVATTERWGEGADRQEKTEWHRVVAWGRTAENAAKYLAKGRSVYVEGRLETKKWTDKNGVERYTTEIVASQVQFLGGGLRDERGPNPIERSDANDNNRPPADDVPF